MAGRVLPPEAEAAIAALADLDLAGLRDRWRSLFGNPAPKSLRRAFLQKACAYGIRTKVLGGPSAAERRRYRLIAEAARRGDPDAVSSVPRIKPGTELLRNHDGKTHRVRVVADGFEWEATRYRSLSAVARAITGTNWNGYAFFGLKRTPIRNKNAAGPHRKRRQAPSEEPGHEG